MYTESTQLLKADPIYNMLWFYLGNPTGLTDWKKPFLGKTRTEFFFKKKTEQAVF